LLPPACSPLSFVSDRLRARRTTLQAIIDAHHANRTTAAADGQHR